MHLGGCWTSLSRATRGRSSYDDTIKSKHQILQGESSNLLCLTIFVLHKGHVVYGGHGFVHPLPADLTPIAKKKKF